MKNLKTWLADPTAFEPIEEAKKPAPPTEDPVKAAERKAKWDAAEAHYNNHYAPKHIEAFKHEMHHQMMKNGFTHVHASSNGKTNHYMHVNPATSKINLVTVHHDPEDHYHYNKHNVAVRHVKSSGSSYSSLDYRPHPMNAYHESEKSPEYKGNEEHEARQHIMNKTIERTHERDLGE